MKILLLIIITFGGVSNLTVQGQDKTSGMVGVYRSRANEFERWSIMILLEKHRFIYKYGTGGCQAEIKGNWEIENKKLIFKNDKEYLKNDIMFYPNLNQTTWTIKKLGIKPDSLIDTGCLKVTQLHIKD